MNEIVEKKKDQSISFEDNYIWAGSKLVIDNYPVDLSKSNNKTKSFSELLDIFTKGCEPEMCFRCSHDCPHKN